MQFILHKIYEREELLSTKFTNLLYHLTSRFSFQTTFELQFISASCFLILFSFRPNILLHSGPSSDFHGATSGCSLRKLSRAMLHNHKRWVLIFLLERLVEVQCSKHGQMSRERYILIGNYQLIAWEIQIYVKGNNLLSSFRGSLSYSLRMLAIVSRVNKLQTRISKAMHVA
jgi:hypothetical protein